jgi:hypothetical protein
MIPCVMLDLSDAGAKLKVEAETQLPSTFILVMSRDGRLNRKCRAAWRKKDVLGVQFLTRESIAPKRSQPTRRLEPAGDLDKTPASSPDSAGHGG